MRWEGIVIVRRGSYGLRLLRVGVLMRLLISRKWYLELYLV